MNKNKRRLSKLSLYGALLAVILSIALPLTALAEETPVPAEEPVIEEALTVEDAPIAEGASLADETPVAEEASVAVVASAATGEIMAAIDEPPVITIAENKSNKYQLDKNAKTLQVGTGTESLSFTLYVEASASKDVELTYVWMRGSTVIEGETKSSLTVPIIPTTEVSKIAYKVTVSAEGAEPKTSAACTVTTYALLFVRYVNQETTVLVGYIDTFLGANALEYGNKVDGESSSAVAKYQWYKNTENSTTGGTSIIGATSTKYTLPNDLAAGTYYYYVVVSSNKPFVAPLVSDVATVTVLPEGAMPIPYPIPVGEKIANSNEFVHWTIKNAQVVSYEAPTELKTSAGTVGDEHYNVTYNIVLAYGTSLDSSVVIHWTKDGSASTVPYVVMTSGQALPSLQADADYLDDTQGILGIQKERGLNVSLTDGELTATLYVYYSSTVYATYTFNFTIKEPDASNDPRPKDVASIKITTEPARKQYFDGGRFDRAGMVVTAALQTKADAEENAEPETTAIYGYTVSPETLSLADTEVTVTFGEGEFVFEAKQPVTVLPSTEISGFAIANGQMFGDIEWNIGSRGLLTFKKYPFLDLLTLYGEETANITFDVGNGVEVYIGEDKQAVGEDGLCRLSLPTTVGGTATIVTLRGEDVDTNYTFTCYAQARAGLPTSVADYLCIGSQYTNGFTTGPYGVVPEATLRGLAASSMSSRTLFAPKSLGNFGGYITWRYDEPITDDPNNPYGIDFVVLGNSYSGHAGYAEPGQVYVSEDGKDWYALAGSLHYNDIADWNRVITYRSDRTVEDSAGFTGKVEKYPAKKVYPLFAWNEETEQAITLSGVYLQPQGGINEYGNTIPPYPHFGYADCGEIYDNGEFNPYTGVRFEDAGGGYTTVRSGRNDGFDLKWAVDNNGEPVTFPNGIQYVKVQTATYIVNAGIGEKSTEVCYMRTAQSTKAQPVGVTAKPTSITVNGNRVDISGVTTVGNALTGNVIDDITVPADGAFLVNVDAPSTANIYINSERGAEATLTTPKHGMLRIIVQEGEQEPWIAYLNLLETGESGEYSRIEFDPVGGTMEGTSRIYMPETTDKRLPVPVWNNRTFLGWYDASATGARVYYTEYNEQMPQNLTLTAGWEYNAVPDVLPPGATPSGFQVTFRLIGATKSKVMGEGEDRNDDIDLGNEYGYKDSEYVTWIGTTTYTVNWGDTMYELFTKALNRAGLAYEGAEKNYVSSITAPTYYGGAPLAEMTNGQRSGWMYTVGQKPDLSDQRHPDRGLLQYDLQPGDIVIWHYVNDYSYEVEDWFEEEDYPSLAKEQGITRFFSKWLEARDANPPNDGTVAPGVGQNGDDEESVTDPATPLGGSGGGSVVATETVTTEAKTDNGKATATVEAATVTEAVTKAKEAVEAAKADGAANAKAEVKIVAKAGSAAETVKSAEVDIPAEAIKAVAAAQDLILTIESDISTVTLDTATLTAIAETAKADDAVKIAAEIGDNSVIELNISVGNTAITALGGTATVSVPYTPDAELAPTDYDLLTVYHLADDGTTTEIKGARYDTATGKITFATNHFSKFLISEWISPFNDIAKGDWYYKAARYAYSNALITGTTPTTFAPQSTLTRAMLATILYRNAVGDGVHTVPPPETPFTDVASGQWYTDAIAWASSNGIVNGTGDNKFAPNAPITREQFATLLYRYTQWSVGGGVPDAPPSGTANLSAYTDAASVSDWAQEAMAWAVATGLITGRTETTLAPEIPANRAEAAMLLQRYLENIA